MFAQRLAGHSIARVTRALYDAGIPCPSAADPSGTRTALCGVDAGNGGGDPGETTVYTGRKVWNLQRTDFDLVDPTNTGLGHRGSSALAGAR